MGRRAPGREQPHALLEVEPGTRARERSELAIDVAPVVDAGLGKIDRRRRRFRWIWLLVGPAGSRKSGLGSSQVEQLFTSSSSALRSSPNGRTIPAGPSGRA